MHPQIPAPFWPAHTIRALPTVVAVRPSDVIAKNSWPLRAGYSGHTGNGMEASSTPKRKTWCVLFFPLQDTAPYASAQPIYIPANMTTRNVFCELTKAAFEGRAHHPRRRSVQPTISPHIASPATEYTEKQRMNSFLPFRWSLQIYWKCSSSIRRSRLRPKTYPWFARLRSSTRRARGSTRTRRMFLPAFAVRRQVATGPARWSSWSNTDIKSLDVLSHGCAFPRRTLFILRWQGCHLRFWGNTAKVRRSTLFLSKAH